MQLEGLCPLTIPAALRRTVAIAPEVEAIVAPDGRLTFAELGREVERIRRALIAAGIARGEHVGLCLGNSTRWVATFLSLGSLGAVTVPINTRFVASEMGYALRQSRVSTLITADRFLRIDFIAMLREIAPDIDTRLPSEALPDLKRLVVIGENVPAMAIGWDTFLAAGDAMSDRAADIPSPAPDDTLLIQYTSGTTSFPKGVLLSQASMLANGFFSGGRVGLRAGDRFHSARPFFHVAGTTLSILCCLQHATTLIGMERFEPGAALELMEREGCTHFSGNDTMALMLLDHPDLARRRLSLRGAWLAASPTVVGRVINELGAREAVVGYGLSEAAPNVAQSAWWEPEAIRVSAAMAPEPGVEIRIGNETAAGEPGEILIRGWNVMKGYFEKPAETAEALSADGWLSTGDLGRIDDTGRLHFLGRAKEIVRVGGENVSPADVENALHRHPKIRQAAVVGVPDARLVEVVAAFVLLKHGCACEPFEIISWARGEMAGFKVPRHVFVVETFEAIGMTASSKIQKKQLAAHALALIEAAAGEQAS